MLRECVEPVLQDRGSCCSSIHGKGWGGGEGVGHRVREVHWIFTKSFWAWLCPVDSRRNG